MRWRPSHFRRSRILLAERTWTCIVSRTYSTKYCSSDVDTYLFEKLETGAVQVVASEPEDHLHGIAFDAELSFVHALR